MIKKLSKLVLKLFLLSLLIIAIIFMYGRMRGATPEQQQAMALLETKPIFKPEENLAAYLWLLRYDVPEDKINAVFASDVEKFNAFQSVNEIVGFQTQAAADYSEINYHELELGEYCRFRAPQGCLDGVEQDQLKIRPVLDASQAAIKRMQHVADYRVHYSPMKLYMEGPLPGFQTGQSLLRVYNADLFIRGQQVPAISNVCREIHAWRSIGANSDILIASMIGHAYVRNNLLLLAEMLARMETSIALPENCREALAPIEFTENMICYAMKGEYGMNKNLEFSLVANDLKFNTYRDFLRTLPSKIMYNQEQYTRKAAVYYANACSEEAEKLAKQNKIFLWGDTESIKNNQCDAVDRVSNSIGCYLSDEVTPNFSQYPGRRLDQSAQITAMQILVWLRENNATKNTIQQLFSSRPNHLRAFSGRIQLNTEKGILQVNLLSTTNDGLKTWEMPMPPSMSKR